MLSTLPMAALQVERQTQRADQEKSDAEEAKKAVQAEKETFEHKNKELLDRLQQKAEEVRDLREKADEHSETIAALTDEV